MVFARFFPKLGHRSHSSPSQPEFFPLSLLVATTSPARTQISCDSQSTNLPRTMISRSAIGPKAQLALRRQCCARPTNRRGLAASISGSTSFSYDTADVNGLKVASRDVAGPTTKLAVIAKAGTRYQPAPGLTSGLEQFAFKVCGYSGDFNTCVQVRD